jgi:hypothetical protein
VVINGVDEPHPRQDVGDGEGDGEPQGHVEKLLHVRLFFNFGAKVQKIMQSGPDFWWIGVSQLDFDIFFVVSKPSCEIFFCPFHRKYILLQAKKKKSHRFIVR